MNTAGSTTWKHHIYCQVQIPINISIIIIIIWYIYKKFLLSSVSDHLKSKAPHPIPHWEVKPLQAWLVLSWGTRREVHVLLTFLLKIHIYIYRYSLYFFPYYNVHIIQFMSIYIYRSSVRPELEPSELFDNNASTAAIILSSALTFLIVDGSEAISLIFSSS